ncbi:MAG: class I SAM-dependent methyltransferase [Lewinellaceae bacterium]|nr:class I SAM-dependent methyltransferase [Lewinellaceae bacterium]
MQIADTLPKNEQQPKAMHAYYRWHAAIYDLTRWAFLFGRNRILKMLQAPPDGIVLEVGCGTGRNLVRLAQSSEDIQLYGVDVSPHMLQKTTQKTSRFSRRVFLFEYSYAPGTFKLPVQVDRVLCSYALTMFNPGFEAAIERAWTYLKPGGKIALVDFHDTPSRTFCWWMGKNHVRMEGHIVPVLEQYFVTEQKIVVPAFGGLWRYVLYTGRKK